MKNKQVKYCIIIPCFEKHSLVLEQTINEYTKHNVDIVVVDDGSSKEYQEIISEICSRLNLLLFVCPKNSGKGGAIKHSIKEASRIGYTHAIQIDSDGQHDHDSFEKLYKLSLKYPQSLISGYPVYDESVPRSRYIARYATHIWVWIETLSLDIKDSMCGFRAYNLNQVIDVLSTQSVGDRMDFDIEIMVKMYWRGVNVKFMPVKVNYPVGGESYFSLWNDNWLITKMHTKLVFGMIMRLPKLLFSKKKVKWTEQKEKSPLVILKITMLILTLFGEKVSKSISRLVSAYYYLFSPAVKKHSKAYISTYKAYYKEDAKKFTALSHVSTFSRSFVDKLLVWKKKISKDRVNKEDVKKFYNAADGGGKIFISSHFGNVEILRALGQSNLNLKFTVLMDTGNSKNFSKILKSLDPKSLDNILFTQNADIKTGIELQERINNKENLFLMGDRYSRNSEQYLTGSLLGKAATFPRGSFLIPYLLKVPIFTIHCYELGGEYRIRVKEITPDIESNRKNRELYMNKLLQSYTNELEEVIHIEPKQWFNFYDFWEN